MPCSASVFNPYMINVRPAVKRMLIQDGGIPPI